MNISDHIKKYDLAVKYMPTDVDEQMLLTLMGERGISLPKVYIEFIKKCGAVFIMSQVMVKCKSTIPNVTVDDHYVSIGRFLDWTKGNFSITYNLKMYEDQFPEYFVPLCEGASGDLIGFHFNSTSDYNISYWAHEQPIQLSKISEDFETFILSIEEHEIRVPDNVKFLLYYKKQF